MSMRTVVEPGTYDRGTYDLGADLGVAAPRLPGVTWPGGWRRFRRHRAAVAALCVLALLVAVAIFGPSVWQASPDTVPLAQIGLGNTPISGAHPLGTDNLGHDTLARLLASLRVSFTVVVFVETVNAVLGICLGLLAGYLRGWVDSLIARVADVLLAFPGILLAVMLAGAFGERADALFSGTGRIFLTGGAIACVSWPLMARYVRGVTMQLREQGYIEAARANGAGTLHIIRTHIAPNLAGLVVVVCSLDAMAVVASEATLSLLGLGVQPPRSSIGLMVNEARDQLDTAPLQIFIPCAMLITLVLVFAFLGDGLRDVFDPRSER